MNRQILVVSPDHLLRETRTAILRSDGYTVHSVSSDDEAMVLLASETFDLVVLGRESILSPGALDQRPRNAHLNMAILKIVDESGYGEFSSRHTNANPTAVLAAVREMLISAAPAPLSPQR